MKGERKGDTRTGLTQHATVKGHRFKFDQTRILERIENWKSRETAEALHIAVRGEERTVNVQQDRESLEKGYGSLITKLRVSSSKRK